eukprot:8953880-Alexandrium_andersonii.AAC.1
MAGRVPSSRGGFAPRTPPYKRLRRAHQPVSSSRSNSARTMMPNPTDEILRVGHVHYFRGRAVQASNT